MFSGAIHQMTNSLLQKERYQYKPKVPQVLEGDFSTLVCGEKEATQPMDHVAEITELFPNTVGQPVIEILRGSNKLDFSANIGIILSGGPAPGGHNVIAGIFDGLKKINKNCKVYGFLGGPSGILEDKKIEITSELLEKFRNTGGFDIIGSGRTKLESAEQFATAFANCEKNQIKGIVIIGGDDSNTNAALLAEAAKAAGNGITVIGCPKTIDGDLKTKEIEASFGFDSAAKVFSELVGNIGRDANSSKKYWHFVRLMGRSASHITLECALQTHPNVTLISEEVAAKKMTLAQIVDDIADSVVKRSINGDNFGLVLIPEGLIEFIPQIKVLIDKLNDVLAHDEAILSKMTNNNEKITHMRGVLSGDLLSVFDSLPTEIQLQLLLDRDPHGNVQVSLIETEKMLLAMVKEKVTANPKFKGKFSGMPHFFGYEGRCGFPTNFDSNYCYSLGLVASLLMANGKTGYMASIRELQKPPVEWVAGGIPTTMLMNMEQRHGSPKPVIRKALVELDGKPFKFLESIREQLKVETAFISPGSIQYFGPTEICDVPTKTLQLEKQ